MNAYMNYKNRNSILVLLSTYNGERYVKKQIISILNQTISDYITIRIRDDGSSDGTIGIIKELIKEYGDKIELIIGKNKGYNASYFDLINNASGYDYYAISDQDDVWLPSKLEEAIHILNEENNKIPLLYASTSYLVNEDLRPYGQTRRKKKEFSIYNTLIQNICPGHTQVFNDKLLRLIKDKNIDITRIYVYDSWITNHAMIYGKIIFNNSSFVYYRQHNNNTLGSSSGTIGRIIKSISRNKSKDGEKYIRQIEYILEKNKEKLSEIGAKDTIIEFLDADSVGKRIKSVIHSGLFRQSKSETIIFYIAYIVGVFKAGE